MLTLTLLQALWSGEGHQVLQGQCHGNRVQCVSLRPLGLWAPSPLERLRISTPFSCSVTTPIAPPPQDDSRESQRKALSSKLGGGDSEEQDVRQAEEKRIKALMKNMEQTEGDVFVSKAAVGSIVGLQSAEIQQMVSEYEEKRAGLEAGKKPDKVVGAQAHARMVAALEKQIALQEKKCTEVRNACEDGDGVICVMIWYSLASCRHRADMM